MRRIHRGIVAMEEEAVQAEVAAAAAETAEIGDNAESLETDLVEITEDAGEQQEVEAQVEEAGEVVEALEAMADALAVSMKNGGLDKHAAAVVGIAVEHMASRVGIKTNSMPAMESFGGASSRIGATRIAMEGIKETAKKIWDSIIAAFQRAIQWAKDFFTKMFSSWEKIQKRAEELAKKADSAKGEGMVTNERLIGALVIDGKAPAISSSTAAFVKFTKETLGSAATSEAYFAAATKSIDDSTPAEAVMGKFAVEKCFLHGVTKVADGEGFPKTTEGLSLFRSEEQFGGQALFASLPEAAVTGPEGAKAAVGISFKVSSYKATPVAVTAKEIPSLDAAGVKSVTDAVIEVAKTGLGYKAVLPKLEVLKKDLIAKSKKLSSKEGVGADARAVLMALARNIDQPGTACSMYTMRTSKSLLDLVEESLKGGSKPKKEAK